MAVSRLARFHAVSYAMRKEKGLDLVEAYPFLAEDPVYRPDTEAMFAKTQNNIATRLFNIFQHSPQDIKVCTLTYRVCTGMSSSTLLMSKFNTVLHVPSDMLISINY